MRVAALGGRDAEEPFDVAAGEEGPVELFELADGVGDGEEPVGHSDSDQPVALRLGRFFRQVSGRFYRMQDPGPFRPEGPIKGVMGR